MTLDIAWAEAADLSQVASPALLLGREPIEWNLRRMVEIAGDPGRLCPHVKTHKLPWLIERQLALGIRRFKCATIAEAEMCARAGALDILLAMQPVGPNVGRFVSLRRAFPETVFSTIIDNETSLHTLAEASKEGGPVDVLLDIDTGQRRTGIAPGPAAAALYRKLAATPGLKAAGLHAYDGNVSQSSRLEREAACEAAFRPVLELREQLRAEGLPVPRLVAGGSPTFAIHAARPDTECSPGTTVLWDASYAQKAPELGFRVSAVLLTRVVSKPAPNRLCLDLGHKAVASENPHPRVIFPRLPEASFASHSEEHLVVETPAAGNWPVGGALLGVPWHVCPTVALYSEVTLIDKGRVCGAARVEGRARRISI